MKFILTGVLAIAFATGLVSCKKCMECKAEGVSGSQLDEVKQEVCGNKTERENFEDAFIATYTAAGYNDVKCD